MKVYKALGVLLTYPGEALIASLGEIDALCADAELSDATRVELTALISELRQTPLLDLQESYVELFDRGRQRSLNLFEHVHGDSNARGQAMIDLQTMYRQNGVDPTGEQLPDYLPMLCEFLSILPGQGARQMLGDLVVIVSLLRMRLEEYGSRYTAVMAALVDLAQAPVDEQELRATLDDETPERPDDFDELDRQWQEAEVTFGAGASHAGAASKAGTDNDGAQLVELRRSKH